HQLGNIFDDAQDFDRAIKNWREAIRYAELVGDLYQAARTRYNVAVALARRERFADAMDYARAALSAFSNMQAVDHEIGLTKELISAIQESLSPEGPKP